MSVKPIHLLILSAAVAGTSAGCATTGGCQSEACSSDAAITSRVQADLRQHPALQAPNSVRVQTVSQVVYLHGHVDTELQRDEAETIARQVPNVKGVNDSLRLTYAGG
jgi:osmotically-inducible protein OsmY